MALYRNRLLRKVFMPIFKALNPGSVHITHHYTKQRFMLDAFKHKGYWFHGKHRETETVKLFYSLIKEGQTVIEVGGHIGYFTLVYADIVKEKGKVFVFEPGTNNLPYIRKNITQSRNIQLIEKAASDTNETLSFYMENLTGQNNSLVKDYNVFQENAQAAYVDVAYEKVDVEAIRLDDFIEEQHIAPDFIKIDVEGAEIMVLKGMIQCMKIHRPILMVELTHNKEEVYNLIKAQNYEILNPHMQLFDLKTQTDFNTFCFHKERHKDILAKALSHA